MRRLPPLSALRAFEAAARRLSFRLAAEELAVTPTAVSHQVRQLEAHLGQPLFVRGVRSVSLTAAGARLFPVLMDGLDAFERTVANLRVESGRRVVTLSTTMAFAARRLAGRVEAFRAANPDLDLRLLATDDPVDLRAGEADAAVRYGLGPWPGLVSEPLVDDRFAPVCSPRLGLAEPGGLAAQTLIHAEWRHPGADAPTWRLWARQAGRTDLDVEAGPRFTDDSHAIQAAAAGQGVVLTSLTLVAEELAAGLLVQPFGPVLAGRRFELVYPPAARDGQAVSALRRWLAEVMA
ncbi:LysR substrate-binding domain-containing protein [Caulobacter rhizosphaerae]|jgi:LysR family glycine cleavage system transcriptional activator|uniref:LysR family glycine cleavage system transcriptional activator n=1 Tax=Caulobacter rhizosphaerae TaxID=2010972 RepID=A0ABU1N0L5_9CAUL|nr:LysR substrate-binding domain-containing protein [Caulobacter rhizosphaerae]MDR6531962.1 LysR family glycine cleavage system transcriptional activator [Caulobacter rhizosphaerae]GGL37609.1 LysR family transcriptional regulator [Caulobacter rhizosphaerae]